MGISSGLGNISFEFFPPQTEVGLTNLTETVAQLSPFNPKFFSVTFGAGGSTQERSLLAINKLLELKVPAVAPHISCIGTTKEKIYNLLKHYETLGIRHLVALRGDLPSGLGTHRGEFHYATDLVEFIRDQTQDYFHIEVAVYPECHPESANQQHDIQYFKQKVAAGANSAITQYFYNAEAYYHLLNECAKHHIDIPIVPGIMPITNYAQLTRFSNLCGAEIPRWLKKSLENYGDDINAIKALGNEVVTRLCEQLLSYGAPGLHFYTLNNATATTTILNRLFALK